MGDTVAAINEWTCYCIESDNGKWTYIGKTNNLARRLRQHNGELSGGAKYTAGRGPFHYAFYVTGFQTESQVLCFEWALHHGGYGGRKSRRRPGVTGAVQALVRVVNKDRWTRKCPLAETIPLIIHDCYVPGKSKEKSVINMIPPDTLPKYVTLQKEGQEDVKEI